MPSACFQTGVLTLPPLQSAQKNIQHPKRVIVPLCPFALARARDVEDVDPVRADKIDDRLGCVFCRSLRRVDQLMRSLLLHAALKSEFRSTAQFLKVNDYGRIGILHVL